MGKWPKIRSISFLRRIDAMMSGLGWWSEGFPGRWWLQTQDFIRFSSNWDIFVQRNNVFVRNHHFHNFTLSFIYGFHVTDVFFREVNFPLLPWGPGVLLKLTHLRDVESPWEWTYVAFLRELFRGNIVGPSHEKSMMYDWSMCNTVQYSIFVGGPGKTEPFRSVQQFHSCEHDVYLLLDVGWTTHLKKMHVKLDPLRWTYKFSGWKSKDIWNKTT